MLRTHHDTVCALQEIDAQNGCLGIETPAKIQISNVKDHGSPNWEMTVGFSYSYQLVYATRFAKALAVLSFSNGQQPRRTMRAGSQLQMSRTCFG